MRKIAVWIATGFGLGYSPVASGTVGALLGLPLAWLLASQSIAVQIGLALLLTLICIPICTLAERELGGRKDDGRIVADEYLTFPICVIGLPWLESGNWWMLGLAFVVNRIMDILKPFPAYRLQSLPAGLGITIDDAISSLYALGINWLICGYLVQQLFPRLAY